MNEDKKVITLAAVDYTEDQLSDTAKMCIAFNKYARTSLQSHQFARPEDRLCAV